MSNLVDLGLPVAIPQSLADQKPEMISQGAEALVFIVRPDKIAKYRPAKPWRLQELDDLLRKRRTTQEARVMQKLAEAQVGAPRLFFVDAKLGMIYMELINGVSLKQATWNAQPADEPERDSAPEQPSPQPKQSISEMPEAVLNLYKQFSESIARMHKHNVVHGDLTTSNAMVADDGTVKIIDFGLSSQNASIEDKAVDIYVLERAIQSTHPLEADLLMNKILMEQYISVARDIDSENCEKVLARLDIVRKRGRKRTQLG